MSGAYPALKFAAFAVVCALFASWLVVMIGNIRPFEGAHVYEAEFDDATGLVTNDEVRISGVPVGRVQEVVTERGRAVARFTVRDDITLEDQTTVGIRWRGVVGLRYLYLYPGGDEELEPGHRFPTERTFSPASIAVALERITPIMRALEPETQNVFLQAMEEALVGREVEIQSLIAEAGDLTQTLASRDQEIGRILENASTLTNTLGAQDEAIKSMLSTFAEASETVAERNDLLERLIVDLSSNQAEFDRLITANEGEIRGALAALDEISAVLAVNRDNFEDVLKYSGHGIIPYHLISRWGNFFLVRFVGTSVGEQGENWDHRGGHPGAQVPPRQEFSDTGAGTSREHRQLPLEDVPWTRGGGPEDGDSHSGGSNPGLAGFFAGASAGGPR